MISSLLIVNAFALCLYPIYYSIFVLQSTRILPGIQKGQYLNCCYCYSDIYHILQGPDSIPNQYMII
jgi:hypothetical protein